MGATRPNIVCCSDLFVAMDTHQLKQLDIDLSEALLAHGPHVLHEFIG